MGGGFEPRQDITWISSFTQRISLQHLDFKTLLIRNDGVPNSKPEPRPSSSCVKKKNGETLNTPSQTSTLHLGRTLSVSSTCSPNFHFTPMGGGFEPRQDITWISSFTQRISLQHLDFKTLLIRNDGVPNSKPEPRPSSSCVKKKKWRNSEYSLLKTSTLHLGRTLSVSSTCSPNFHFTPMGGGFEPRQDITWISSFTQRISLQHLDFKTLLIRNDGVLNSKPEPRPSSSCVKKWRNSEYSLLKLPHYISGEL
ncbi:hypothetical protein TNCV_1952271 [Trichonephila clavipes]|nr:hypothetical protein TNCV_1952271 [Trichonephila clavipes]